MLLFIVLQNYICMLFILDIGYPTSIYRTRNIPQTNTFLLTVVRYLYSMSSSAG